MPDNSKFDVWILIRRKPIVKHVLDPFWMLDVPSKVRTVSPKPQHPLRRGGPSPSYA